MIWNIWIPQLHMSCTSAFLNHPKFRLQNVNKAQESGEEGEEWQKKNDFKCWPDLQCWSRCVEESRGLFFESICMMILSKIIKKYIEISWVFFLCFNSCISSWWRFFTEDLKINSSFVSTSFLQSNLLALLMIDSVKSSLLLCLSLRHFLMWLSSSLTESISTETHIEVVLDII